jgi:hypothetical protein
VVGEESKASSEPASGVLTQLGEDKGTVAVDVRADAVRAVGVEVR